MSKFKVGDLVKVNKSALGGFYKQGAEGVVIYSGSDNLKVRFCSGLYDRSCDGSWWVGHENLNLIKQEKETKMKKSEGCGLGSKSGEDYVITAWAVEVDGKIDPNLVYKSRSTARAVRNFEVEDDGTKAVVRKIKIEVLKGKI